MILNVKLFCLIILILFNISASWAVPTPLRDLKVLQTRDQEWGPSSPSYPYQIETAVHLPGAKVVVADYKLIHRDFPTTQKWSYQQINNWLIKKAAYVSKTQYDLGFTRGVNEEIAANPGQTAQVYRPVDYGRAFVLTVGKTPSGEDLLIDAKGVGAVNPLAEGTHTNGIGSIAEFVREYAMEKLVHAVFEHYKATTPNLDDDELFDTIETYAVLDLGFQGQEYGKWLPAGALLRQAHIRQVSSSYQLQDKYAFAMEKVLRKYGVSSIGMILQKGFGYSGSIRHNIQGTSDGLGIVDFATYIVSEKFTNDLEGRDFGEFPKVESIGYVQPIPHLLVEQSVWFAGYASDGTYINRPKEWLSPWIDSVSQEAFDSLQFSKLISSKIRTQKKLWKN